MREIKDGISSPQTTAIENPPVSATERPIPAGHTEIGAVSAPHKQDKPDTPENPNNPDKPQGYSEPQTTVVENPPKSATETPVPAGYTEVRTSQLPSTPTGTSAG